MNDIKREVLELADQIENGVNEYDNVNKVISILSVALEKNEIEKAFALEIDERLGLEYFC